MAFTHITFTEPIESALEEHPEHVRAIGMISIEIGNLELAIANVMSTIINVDAHQGNIIYFTPKAAIARLETLQNVSNALPERFKAASKIVDKLIERSRSVIGKRHEYMHNAWGFSREVNQVTRRALPQKQRLEGEMPVPIGELHSLIKKIRRIRTDAMNAMPTLASILRPATSPQVLIEVGPRIAPPSVDHPPSRPSKPKGPPRSSPV